MKRDELRVTKWLETKEECIKLSDTLRKYKTPYTIKTKKILMRDGMAKRYATFRDHKCEVVYDTLR